MSKAIKPNTTSPPPAAPPAYAVAALTAAGSAPSIISLAQHLADAERAYGAYDSADVRLALEGTAGYNIHKANDIASRGESLLDARVEALHSLIITLPPADIADVAVHIAAITTIAGRLSATNFAEDQVEEMATDIVRLAHAALPIVAQAAGLDLDGMNWRDLEDLRLSYWQGAGGAA